MRWPAASKSVIIVKPESTREIEGKLLTLLAGLRAAAWAFATFPETTASPLIMALLVTWMLEPVAAFSVVHLLRRFNPVPSVCTDPAFIISLIFFESCHRSEYCDVVAFQLCKVSDSSSR